MAPPGSSHDIAALLDEAGTLRRLAAAILRGGAAADVDDVVQDAWVAALTVHDIPRQRGWLATVVERLALTVLRRRTRREARERTVARPEAVASTAEVETRLALHRAVVTAVESLDELHRDAVLRRYFDGTPPRQIAADLGLPVATVKTRLRRALVELRARLKREWGAEFGAALVALARKGQPAAGGATLVVTTGAVVMTMKAKFLLASALIVVAVGGAQLIRWSGPPVGDGARRSVAPDPAHAIAADATNPAAAASSVARTEDQLQRDSTPPNATGPNRIGAIAGIVRGPGGAPLAGAEVDLLRRLAADVSATSPEEYDLIEERRTTASDTDGRFRFDGVPRTSRCSLRARAEPGLRGKGLAGIEAGDEKVVLELAPAARLAGRVTNVAGDAIPELTIVVDARGDVRDVRLPERARTDANGEFALSSLAPGGAEVFAITPSGNARFPTLVTLKGGEETRVDLKVEGPFGVDGVVVDDATGAPIEAAQLTIGFLQGEPIARSDAKGCFQVRTDERWQDGMPLEIWARGYASRSVHAPNTEAVATGFEIRMKHGHRVHGRILLDSGLPVENAIVGVKPLYAGEGIHLSRPAESALTKSAADGTFTIAGVGRDGSHVLLVRGDECADTVLPFPANECDGDEFDLGDVVVDRGTLVTGRVFDDAGNVVLRPSLQLRPAAAADSPTLEPSVPLNVALYDFRDFQAEPDGRFVIPRVARGKWVVHAGTSSRLTPSTTEFVVDGKSDMMEVNCRLDAGLTLTGRVKDENGVAIPSSASVMVYVTHENASHSSFALQRLDGDGRFRLTGLAAGTYSLRIDPQGPHAPAARWLEPIRLHGVNPGGPELDLVMRECVPLRIKVVDESDHVISGARVRLLDEDREERADGQTGKEGTTTVGLVPESSYQLEVFRKWNLFQASAAQKPDLVRDDVHADGEELVLRLPREGS